MEPASTSLRTRYGYIEGWLSIILNTLLFALKYWAGLASGSVAIIADAWHTLSDSLTSIVVLVGIRISADPADDRHPFGHGRAELIGSIIIGVLLALVAVNFVADSVEKLIDRQAARYGTLAIAATAASVVLKEILAQVALRMGKKTNAQSLIADGWHHRSDAISSLVILAGIFAGRYLWWIDAAMGIAVSLVILYAAWEILKKAASSLIGEDADPGLAGSIDAIARRHYGSDLNIHHLHLHRYGDHLELTFHMRLPPEMQLAEAHAIASRIEHDILSDLGIEATIHLEPCTKHEESA